MYFEYRTTGTHGMFLLNSNGMDTKITNSGPGGTVLEDNVIGVIQAFSFFAGSEEDPGEVARQYAEVAGLPAEVPYWFLGSIHFGLGTRVSICAGNLLNRQM